MYEFPSYPVYWIVRKIPKAFIPFGILYPKHLALQLPETPYVTADPQEFPKRRIIDFLNIGDTNSPFLQVSQSNAIETVRANGRHAAEDGQSAWTPKREVSFVFHALKPTSWWHIPVKDYSQHTSFPPTHGGVTSQRTHCLNGLEDTAAYEKDVPR